MIRCPNEMEYRDWLRSLYTQINCSPAINYIRPTLPPNAAHPSKVLIVDLGSTSVRAGILGNMRKSSIGSKNAIYFQITVSMLYCNESFCVI